MFKCMRTTITLDDDVAATLERKTRDLGFNEFVNDVLRRGLNEMRTPAKRREPFRTRSVSLGRSRLPNIDNVTEGLAITEGESFN